MTEVDKRKILQILRDRGLHARAEWVDRQLTGASRSGKERRATRDPAYQPIRTRRSAAMTGLKDARPWLCVVRPNSFASPP
jgi:hypothetical protein